MVSNHKLWLQSTDEEVIEPDLPICDAHHHFWDRKPQTRPEDRFLLDDYLDEISSGHNIISSIFVECKSMFRKAGPAALRPVGETEFVQGIAAMSASGQYGPARIAAGIVGYADMTLGDAVAPVLEAHLIAGAGRFRGVRFGCAWDASSAIPNPSSKVPPGILLDTTFRQGVACLQKHGLVFDALLFHPQLPELVSLARSLDGVTFVLEHIGGVLGIGPYAGKRDAVFSDWKRDMAELARCPNVCVKLGGFGLDRIGFGWQSRDRPPGSEELTADIGPYLLACIELFGPERCMFESNTPIDLNAYSYKIIWNCFKRITREFSAQERKALFHDTATRVYRLA